MVDGPHPKSFSEHFRWGAVSESKISGASPAPRWKLLKLKHRKYNWAPLLFDFVTLNLFFVDFIYFFF